MKYVQTAEHKKYQVDQDFFKRLQKVKLNSKNSAFKCNQLNWNRCCVAIISNKNSKVSLATLYAQHDITQTNFFVIKMHNVRFRVHCNFSHFGIQFCVIEKWYPFQIILNKKKVCESGNFPFQSHSDILILIYNCRITKTKQDS